MSNPLPEVGSYLMVTGTDGSEEIVKVVGYTEDGNLMVQGCNALQAGIPVPLHVELGVIGASAKSGRDWRKG